MRFLRATSLAFLAMLAACQTPVQAGLNEKLFLDMVLDDENHKVHKWEKENIIVGVGFNSYTLNVDTLANVYLGSSLQKISDASGLTFSVRRLNTSRMEDFDIAIYFIVGSISDFIKEPVGPNDACITFAAFDDYTFEYHPRIVVPAEDADYCLEHEMLHALGVWHADQGDTVMLTKNYTRTDMSEFDKQLLSILYNKEVKAGMTSEEVLPIARRLALRNIECQGSLNVPQCMAEGATTPRVAGF